MVLQLDPRLPLVWRSPQSLQLGVDDPAVVISEVSEAEERMLAALVAGVSRPGLSMIAASSGADESAVESLLRAVAPAMRSKIGEPVPATVTLVGRGPTADLLTGALAASGVRLRLPGPDPDLGQDVDGDGFAVIVAHFVIEPEFHGRWLRRDVPHLPIVFGDTGARVGPIVEPGDGPCLYCLERTRTDADRAWPAIASQLWGRRSPADGGLIATEVAAIAARIVISRLRAGPGDPVSVRLDAETGVRTERTWHPHPECGCAALPGTGTAVGGRNAVARLPPRRDEAAREPA